MILTIVEIELKSIFAIVVATITTYRQTDRQTDRQIDINSIKCDRYDILWLKEATVIDTVSPPEELISMFFKWAEPSDRLLRD